ncbi:MAG: TIGR03067 domain-containing protein [Planctomycetia bacterium]|nr:TIGR03067 domain-containing protein [Planctomycetia bacterium]
MWKVTAIIGLGALTMAGAGGAYGAEGAADLVGGYMIVSGEMAGVPEREERIKGSVVRFSEDRVVVVDKQSKELFGASYKLDTARTPWRITMTSKLSGNEGQVAQGLIEKDGDTVRLIYALPGGQPPTDFKTKEKQLMFVMKPVKQ